MIINIIKIMGNQNTKTYLNHNDEDDDSDDDNNDDDDDVLISCPLWKYQTWSDPYNIKLFVYIDKITKKLKMYFQYLDNVYSNDDSLYYIICYDTEGKWLFQISNKEIKKWKLLKM